MQAKPVGCFLIDAPMGLQGDSAWTLEELVSLVMLINSTFTPPFTIVIYSLYSMGEVQRALNGPTSPLGGSNKEKLQLTQFLMVKVRLRTRGFGHEQSSHSKCLYVAGLFAGGPSGARIKPVYSHGPRGTGCTP